MATPTILIIEDEITIAHLLQSLLEEEGYYALVAHNGVEGLECLKRQRVDLVLCDWMMPIMNGQTFFAQLQSSRKLRSTPVIFMSAAADSLRDLGITGAGLIRKPFDLLTVLETIEAVLHGGSPYR